MNALRVLTVSGSLRARSSNTEVLRALRLVAASQFSVTHYAGLATLPAFNPDLDEDGMPAPPSVQDLRNQIVNAQALVISSPEYAHGVPGSLKNALDWASRPLAESPVRNKPVAVLSSSTGMFGGVWAAAETRKVLGALGARTL